MDPHKRIEDMDDDELRELAEHIAERQINPQLYAAEMRARGLNVSSGMVSTDPNASGFLVRCVDCGRTARAPFDPGTQAVMCPPCVQKRQKSTSN